ncbi:polymorphic toxin-type HINT domain-containing protein [Gemmata sp. JC673]|uniref:Polymorphic toxin-type HINT domain-containing protein n=1 Tax=Gemmata algarum TaxID=2975278 RepID=A0ABU5F6E5_9BACT|nr:polymorphic toxin-type HINT domain-containing protein [Gemmata algarum]MDY3562921.1 polymorphic toxin-type HINT domain-containing protein [Gemmata algarum]
MPTPIRRLANHIRASFTRLDRLFALRADFPSVSAARARLEITPLEERVVPDGTQVTLSRLADGAEPGTPVVFRFTRSGDEAAIAGASLAVSFQLTGSATHGVDYSVPGAPPLPGGPPGLDGGVYEMPGGPGGGVAGPVSVTFTPGQSVYDLNLVVLDDTVAEGWEAVTAQLLPVYGPVMAGSAYVVGTPDPVTAWIADDELWIETDEEPPVRGQEVTFWLAEDAPAPAAVEWDSDYDGVTFQPAAGATGTTFTTTYATAGNRTVAARVTGAGGAVQVLTLPVDVEPAPPELTVPNDMTAVVGVSKPLVATVAPGEDIVSVEWAFSFYSDDYEWDFEVDPALTTLNPNYTFAHAGEWDVRVTVTSAAGLSTQDWFHVTVADAPPAGFALASGPIDEGGTATVTVWIVDPDAADIVTAYVNWGEPAEQEFVQINEGDYRINPDGSISFTHRYLDVPDSGNTFTATIRLEDEWGLQKEFAAAVTVNNVAPNFVFSAGWQAADLGNDWVELWSLTEGQALAFTKVADPMTAADNPHEDGEYRFHWVIDGAAEVVTQTPWLALPDYTRGKLHTVRAWVTDGETPEGPHVPVKVFVEGPQDNAEVTWGGVRSHAIYGTFTLDGTAVPADFNPYVNSNIHKVNWPVGTAATVRFSLDPASALMAATFGYEVVYHAQVRVYDVEQFSIGGGNFELLDSTHLTNGSGAFTVPVPNHDDRMVTIFGWAYFVHNGQIVRGVQSYIGTEEAGGLGVTLETPKTPTTWSQVVDTYLLLRSLGSQLADKGEALVSAFAANSGRVVNVLLEGFAKGVGQFVSDLVPSQNPDGSVSPGALADALFKWLMGDGQSALVTTFGAANWADANTIKEFLLQYSGLTIEHVMDVVREQLGAGNLAALEKVTAWFEGADGTPVTSVRAFIDKVKAEIDALTPEERGALSLDPAVLMSQMKEAFEKKVTESLGKLGAQVAAKFVPGAGALLSVYNGVSWVIANKDRLTGLFTQFLSVIDTLGETGLSEADAIAAVKSKVRAGLQDALPVLLGGMAGQFGLGNLPNELRRAVQYVPQKVNAILRTVVAKVAAKVAGGGAAAGATPGGTSGTLFDGRIAPAKQFVYRGTTTYVLWVATDKAGVSVKLAKKVGAGYEFVDVVTVQGLIGRRADAQLNALLAAARELAQKTKVSPQSANKPTPAALLELARKVEAAEAKVVEALQANAFGKLASNCFAAGTKIMTRAGWRNVEDVRPGEEVLSRPERDPGAEAEWKVVEERFERFGPVLHLHFSGGELIRTTPEHPFWVQERGWTAAGALKEGDRIATLSGEWVPVGEVYDTGTWEPVYNLRVADYHTYFVGEEHWGWAAWAHNTYDASINFLSGLKVVEEVKSYPAAANRLTTGEESDIIRAIRTRGKYGAMGQQSALSSLLAYELWFEGETAPGYMADVPGVLKQYLDLPAISVTHLKEEKRITGGPMGGWMAYIDRIGGDAFGRTKAAYKALYPNQTGIHGHHIVYKDGSDTPDPIQLEASQVAAREARDILLYYGINPFWDKENLVFAPKPHHPVEAIEYIRNQLKISFDRKIPKSTPVTGIIDILKQMGQRFIDQDLPGMKNYIP